jgi:hypothetical protein
MMLANQSGSNFSGSRFPQVLLALITSTDLESRRGEAAEWATLVSDWSYLPSNDSFRFAPQTRHAVPKVGGTKLEVKSSWRPGGVELEPCEVR